MRDLASLGISPAPWKVGAIAGDDKGLVVFDRNNCAVVLMHEFEEYRKADARLIAAAPTMFSALHRAIAWEDAVKEKKAAPERWCDVVSAMKDALIKAGG